MNPIELLTEKDKEAIYNYCSSYGKVVPQDVDIILAEWNKNKRTLCKAFGNQLRISKPLNIKKDATIMKTLLSCVYSPVAIPRARDMSWWADEDYHNEFINNLCDYIKSLYIKNTIDIYTISKIALLFSYTWIADGYTKEDVAFIYSDKASLIISNGTKILRAIQKMLKYIEYQNLVLFTQWQNMISDIKTSETIHQNLVLSIHPLDYMTMSDNNSGWSSCMSWIKDGCYSLGTIEMMNSNLIVVAYLENKTPFSTEATKDYLLSNKSWRCLLYVHKSIIMSGKSYPYRSKEVSLEAINMMREQVKEKFGWDYQYKDQEYQDCCHIKSNESIYYKNNYDLNHKYNGEEKHAILFYTNAMYNDLVNDNGTRYWCCRNYVDKTLRISASGKPTCLCCGNRIYDDDGEWDGGTSRKYCAECYDKYYCSMCGKVDSNIKHYTIPMMYTSINKTRKDCCKKCINELSYSLSQKVFAFNKDLNNIKEVPVLVIYNQKKFEDLLLKSVKTRNIYYIIPLYEWSDEDLQRLNSDNSILKIVYLPYYYLIKEQNWIEMKEFDVRCGYSNFRTYCFHYGTKNKDVERIVDEQKYNFIQLSELSQEEVDAIIHPFLHQ